jgi:hypothetical protein
VNSASIEEHSAWSLKACEKYIPVMHLRHLVQNPTCGPGKKDNVVRQSKLGRLPSGIIVVRRFEITDERC